MNKDVTRGLRPTAQPRLSEQARSAAEAWEAIVRVEEEKQAAVAAAERAFQNGEEQWLERLARDWAEAAYALGRTAEQLESAMDRFIQALVVCGLSAEAAGDWHPRHVLPMRPGDDLSSQPGPVSGGY